jgi:hypothetical protein
VVTRSKFIERDGGNVGCLSALYTALCSSTTSRVQLQCLSGQCVGRVCRGKRTDDVGEQLLGSWSVRS